MQPSRMSIPLDLGKLFVRVERKCLAAHLCLASWKDTDLSLAARKETDSHSCQI